MKVLWTRRARRHLNAHRDLVAKDSEQNVALVIGRIVSAAALLETNPLIGRIGRMAGTRELVVPRTPSVVPYRVKKQSVELLAVIHGHRDWPPLKM